MRALLAGFTSTLLVITLAHVYEIRGMLKDGACRCECCHDAARSEQKEGA